MSGAICDGGSAYLRRRVAYCPTEGRRRRFVVRIQPWYGAVWYCTACGDSWADGERGYRPFERGWRQRAITRARALWAQAPARYDREAFMAWLTATL